MTPGPAFLDRRRHITSDVMMSLFLGIPANYLYGGGWVEMTFTLKA